MEIRLVAGALTDEQFEKGLVVVDDLDAAIADVKQRDETMYFFSLMDTSLDQTTAELR